MSLSEYHKKRNFKKTKEPSGSDKIKPDKSQSIFVIQKHDATRLHYDFRIEADGVLKSWAVPKGPSNDPKQKRLAMMVEDHPYSYRDFEGRIPEGSYGAGEVIVWDTGTYTVEDLNKEAREKYVVNGVTKGKIAIVLHGQKLNGKFALVKMHGKEDNAWLLIKELDEYVSKEDHFSSNSVLSEAVLTRDADSSPAKKTSTKKQKLPDFFTPMLATLVDKPFTKKDWIFENKLDGYRALSFINKNTVELRSRNNILLNSKFTTIVKELQQLPFQAVFDGELVGISRDNQIAFQSLQGSNRNQDELYYYVFDLPHLEGNDLSKMPLVDRKKLLKKAVHGLSHVKYVDHFSDGNKLFEKAKAAGQEGIIAKKSNSTYQPNVRGSDWLKIKITRQQEAIICGYTKPQGSRKHFGSLLLGIYQDNVLHYVGHTGSGFPTAQLETLKKQLDELQIKHSPFSGDESIPEKDVTWVKPLLVCEVKYAEWTNDNILRQAIFQTLRPDKNPSEVVIEKPTQTKNATEENRSANSPNTASKLHLSHLDKIYWPKLGLRKQDLIEYYRMIAPTILPYLKHRPESLRRSPNGIVDDGFFQKDITFDVPDFVELVTITSEDVGDTRYMVCNNEETLLYMANLGCIEINPWNSRVESLDCPDYFVIDLDPVEVPFSSVVKVATVVKEVLDEAKITAYCKTSGKKGIHIFIPLHGKYETEVASTFAKLVASLTYQRLPDITSLERSPSDRQNKVYVDFLQNRKGQTVAAPYSLRPTPDATASTPLHWDELTPSLDPKDFTIKTLPQRIKKLGDIWAGMLKETNDLKVALKHLQLTRS